MTTFLTQLMCMMCTAIKAMDKVPSQLVTLTKWTQAPLVTTTSTFSWWALTTLLKAKQAMGTNVHTHRVVWTPPLPAVLRKLCVCIREGRQQSCYALESVWIKSVYFCQKQLTFIQHWKPPHPTHYIAPTDSHKSWTSWHRSPCLQLPRRNRRTKSGSAHVWSFQE